MEIIIKPELSRYGDASGYRVYVDGMIGRWNSGYADRTSVSVYTRHIQASDLNGGTITIYDSNGKIRETHKIEGCPTGHKNVRDDFMGGQVCLDCKAVW